MKKKKSIFKGKLLKLHTERRRLPNGYVATLEVITHPGAALIVPFLSKNEIIFLRQYRPVINSYIYELPAGTLDRGESPFVCAKREIIEETGYAARRIKRIGFIYPAPGYTNEKITIFIAEGLCKKETKMCADEVLRSFSVDKARTKKLLKDGKIVDAKTICALAMCGWV